MRTTTKIALVSGIFVVTLASTLAVLIPPKEERIARAEFSKILRDPESLQLRNISIGFNESICGEYNAKNAYGAHVGFKRFVIPSGMTFQKMGVRTDENPEIFAIYAKDCPKFRH